MAGIIEGEDPAQAYELDESVAGSTSHVERPESEFAVRRRIYLDRISPLDLRQHLMLIQQRLDTA